MQPILSYAFTFDMGEVETAGVTWLKGDVDGDGRDEAIRCDSTTIRRYDADPSGQFICRTTAVTESGVGVAWLCGDVNRDGKAEIIHLFGNGGALAATVYSDDGTGSLRVLSYSPNLGASPTLGATWLICDVNGDHKAEVIQCWTVFGGLQMGITLLGADDSGTLKVLSSVQMPGVSGNWLIGDVNGDTRPELIQYLNDGGQLAMTIWGVDDGNAVKPLGTASDLGAYSTQLFVGDVDGDRRDEIVQCWPFEGTTATRVYAVEQANVVQPIGQLNLMAVGDPGTPMLGDVDGDGRAELVRFRRNVDGALGAEVYAADDFDTLRISSAAHAVGENPGSNGPPEAWLCGRFTNTLLDAGAPRSPQEIFCASVTGDDHLSIRLYREGRAYPPLDDDATKRNLLVRHAPRVWLAKGEDYYPSPVELAFANMVRFQSGDGTYWIQTRDPLGPPGDPEPDYLHGQKDLRTVPVYAYWVDKKQFVDLVYFFYYPYNFGKGSMTVVFGNHVSDWEHVTIRLVKQSDGSLLPQQVYVAVHDFGGASYLHQLPSIMGLGGPHLVVYAASGSHGCWTSGGSHVYAHVLTDECSEGQAWDTWNKVVSFDFNGQRSLDSGGPWPQWMNDDFKSPGPGPDPTNPANGPIYRWGNAEEICVPVVGKCELEDGPEGPISKQEIWSDDRFE